MYINGNTTRLVGDFVAALANGVKVVCPAFRRCPGECGGRRVVACVPPGLSFSCSIGSLGSFFGSGGVDTLLLIGPSGPSNGFVLGGSLGSLLR